jgi:hypothetical protein
MGLGFMGEFRLWRDHVWLDCVPSYLGKTQVSIPG